LYQTATLAFSDLDLDLGLQRRPVACLYLEKKVEIID